MTENQKAATFIGWAPNKPCEPPMMPSKDGRPAWGFCGCGYIGKSEPHILPEPDMSWPGNWGSALEAIVAQGYEPSLEYVLYELTQTMMWRCDIFANRKERMIRVYDAHCATAILTMLATLYDAEH